MLRTTAILEKACSIKTAQKYRRLSSSAVSVLTNTDKGLQVDENNLKQVFLQDNISDLPVCCISVAGAMRTGKSFLLEPVIINGVAVFLTDTQGTFDRRSTVRENMTIFAMACLTSSHLVYNLMHIIREDQLQNLQLFTDERFKLHLDALVQNSFAPDKLLPKRIGGRSLKVVEMYDLYVKYMEIFSADSLPEPQSIYLTTSKLVFLHALKDSKEMYVKGLEETGIRGQNEPETTENLRKIHNNLKKKSLIHFKSSTKFGDSENRRVYETTLENDINKYFITIDNLNQAKIQNRYHTAKDNYTAELDSEFQKSQEPFHETDLNKLHLQVKTRSINMFVNKEGKYFSADLNTKLVQNISSRYEDYKKLNLVRIQIYFRKIQDEVIRKYKEKMENALEGPFSIHELKLTNEHETVKKELLAQFSSTNDYGSTIIKENSGRNWCPLSLCTNQDSTSTALAKIMDEKSGIFKEMNEQKTLKNRVTRTVKQLGDNETYKDVWTNPQKQKILASSVITIIIIKSYLGF